MRAQRGFTLMEVLVAMVIVGITVTVFFQLFSTSMRLEIKSRDKLAAAFEARQTFEDMLRLDIRDEDFAWEGEIGDKPWKVGLHPVQVPDPEEDQAGETNIRLEKELYALVFSYYAKGEDSRPMKFMIYEQYDPGYLTEDFKSEHLGDPLDDPLETGSGAKEKGES